MPVSAENDLTVAPQTPPSASENPAAPMQRPSGMDPAVSLKLHAEDITIQKRRVVSGTVQVQTVTRSRDRLVEEPLRHERVEVERIAVDRQVDAVPPVRVEGDTTIVPVVEEVVVVERRLVLREEVHIRRLQVTGTHRETVALREQDVVVRRLDQPTVSGPGASPAAATQTPGEQP